MAEISAEPSSLQAATAEMRPVADRTGTLGKQVSQLGSDAVVSAGSIHLDLATAFPSVPGVEKAAAAAGQAKAAIGAHVHELAQALAGTERIVSTLSEITQTTATEFTTLAQKQIKDLAAVRHTGGQSAQGTVLADAGKAQPTQPARG